MRWYGKKAAPGSGFIIIFSRIARLKQLAVTG